MTRLMAETYRQQELADQRVVEERDRLRPLLERLEADVTILSRAFGFVEPARLADLRRELGLSEGER